MAVTPTEPAAVPATADPVGMDMKMMPCPACGGTGEFSGPAEGAWPAIQVRCETCEGTGEVPHAA